MRVGLYHIFYTALYNYRAGMLRLSRQSAVQAYMHLLGCLSGAQDEGHLSLGLGSRLDMVSGKE